MAVATMGLTAAITAQVPSYVPTNGLVGYWPFNGNANDESGNGNNGTVNGATLTSDRNGIANSAYSFDGVNCATYIDVNVNTTSIQNTHEYSISLWVLKAGAGCMIHPRILEFYSLNDGALQFNWDVANTDYLMVETINSNGLYQATTHYSQNWLNSWNQIVFTVKSGLGCLYLNGTLINSFQFIGQPNLTPIGSFGRMNHPSYNTMNGKLDDIGIWDRALTQQEITALYNGCQLSVNAQPNNQTSYINNNAQFIVGTSDTNATYQWQTDLGIGFQNLNSVGQYSGTTNDTLTISNVSISNNNQPFRCIINNGSCTDTSATAVLTVLNNTGINENSQNNLFSVFPNPAQSTLYVKADNKLIGSVFTIYDNIGKIVKSGKLNTANTTIELGNLSNGMYLFSIGDHKKQPFKIIKE